MSLRYILGRPGTGKTKACIDEILHMQNNGAHKGLIYIVPEQFSLQSENELVKNSGVNAIMQAQVLSFQRLAYHVFAKTGGNDKKILEDIGKSMLLRKIVNESKDKLLFFSSAVDKQGFMERLCETVTEFYKYNMTVDRLKRAAENISGNESLRLKLTDLHLILERFKDYQLQNYISEDEALDLLAEKAGEAPLLKNSHVWLDGFNGFTPQEYRVIEKLLKTCCRVSITLTADSVEFLKNASIGPYYYSVKKTFDKLNGIADENNIPIEEVLELREIYRLNGSPALKHLEINFFHKNLKRFSGETKGIKIVAASNMYHEVEFVAAEISNLVRQCGYKYNEIGILSCSLGEYDKIINSIFSKHKIPLFIDTKTDIMSHPLIEMIRAVFNIIIENWSYESVFRFLKTNLVCLNIDDIDLVENYVLSNGIRGGKWNKPWEYGFNTSYEVFEKEAINEIREKIINILKPLTNNLKPGKKYSIKYISTQLYLFLQEINIPEIINNWSVDLINAGNIKQAKEHTQIWGKFIKVLDKMVEILGGSVVGLDEYSKIIDAGFSETDLGVIPPSLDQVIAGDLRRSRISEIKALFVLGATESALPSKFTESGLLVDEDRVFLEKGCNIELMPNSFIKSYEEYFLVYSAISKPRNFLCVSYYMGGLDGKSFLPSPIIKKIKNLFVALEETEIKGCENDPLTSTASAYNALLSNIPEFIERGDIPGIYKDIYSVLTARNFQEGQFLNILENLGKDNCKLILSRDSVDKIYDKVIRTSVSRLEKYIKCPFSYFSQYNLAAQKRKVYEIESIDLGNLLHDVLDDFSKKIKSNNVNWRNMQDSEVLNFVSDSVNIAINKETNEIFKNSSRYKYFADRAKKIAVNSISAIMEHMRNGEFDFNYSEAVFSNNAANADGDSFGAIEIELGDKVKMLLEGRIDRVDSAKINDKEYIKIIDYKSGNAVFSFPEVFYGLQLQLIVYLDAFIKKYKEKFIKMNIFPAAVLYFKLDNPLLDFEKINKNDTLEMALLKKFKMSGVVVDDPNVIKSIDNSFESKSNIIPVGVKSSGIYKNAAFEERPLTDSSSALSIDDFYKLMDFVCEKARAAGKDILTGDISASPYKYADKSACSYCEYKAVCRFDPVQNAAGFKIMEPIKSKEAIDKILRR